MAGMHWNPTFPFVLTMTVTLHHVQKFMPAYRSANTVDAPHQTVVPSSAEAGRSGGGAEAGSMALVPTAAHRGSQQQVQKSFRRRSRLQQSTSRENLEESLPAVRGSACGSDSSDWDVFQTGYAVSPTGVPQRISEERVSGQCAL